MNMQQLMMQAQKMQREMAKQQEALKSKVFEASANGGVTIQMKGDYSIVGLDIDNDLLNPESKDILTDMIKNALSQVLKQVSDESEAIQDKAANNIRF